MKWMILALLSVITACSSAPREPLKSAAGIGATQADLSKYQTFAFAPANPPAAGYQTTARSLEVQRRVTPLVQASLEKRGFAQSAENADLVIKISAGSGSLPEEKVDRGIAGETPSGFIGIDAYDRATGTGVWHGTAFAEIDPARIDDQLLALGVEHMLADFPPRAQ